MYNYTMYISVKAIAGAEEEQISVISSNKFQVSVREKAEKNLANKRIVRIMALHFNLPAGRVRIISGHHSPSKILSIDL